MAAASALGDRWHAPKVGPKGGFKNGTFRRRLSSWVSGQVSYSEGFRRVSEGLSAGFRDTWPPPKGSEGGSGEGFEGALGRASRRLRKSFGTRGALRRPPKGGAPGWHLPKGSSKGFPRGSSKGSREGLPD